MPVPVREAWGFMSLCGSLRARLIVSILGLAIPLLLLCGIVGIRYCQDGMKRAVGRGLQNVASQRAGEASAWVQGRKDELGMMSDHCLLEADGREHLTRWLERMPARRGPYRGVFVVDRAGRIVYSVGGAMRQRDGDEPFRSCVRAAVGGRVTISSAYYDETVGEPVLLAGAPVLQERRIVGAIIARISLGSLESAWASVDLGRTGQALLVERRRVLLPSRHFGAPSPALVPLGKGPGLTSALTFG